MAGINFTCPSCGKAVRIEIMEIDRLRRRVAELEGKLAERSSLDALAEMMGMGRRK